MSTDDYSDVAWVPVDIDSLSLDNPQAAIDPAANLQLGAAVAEQIQVRNLRLPAQGFTLAGLGIGGLNIGCLDLTLRVNPHAEAHIDQLVITNVKASTSIGRIELRKVVAPYELLDLTLSQIGIDTLQVPSVAIA